MIEPGQPVEITAQPKKSKKIIWTVIAAAGLLAAGAAGFYYFYLLSPERILLKMSEQITKVKTSEYTGEIKLEIEKINLPSNPMLSSAQLDLNKTLSNLVVTYKGITDVQDANNRKMALSYSVTVATTTPAQPYFSMDTIRIGEVIYARVSNVPELAIFDLSGIKNQWVKIDLGEIKKQLGLDKSGVSQEVLEVSPEQIKQLKAVVEKNKIIKITKKFPDEKIGDINTYHYRLAVDKTGLENILTEMAKTYKTPLDEKGLAKLDKFLEDMGPLEAEVWIGKKDFLPYKFYFEPTIPETDGSQLQGKIKLTVLYKNYNKPVQIEAPAQTKSLTEFLAQLYGGVLGGLNSLSASSSATSTFKLNLNKDSDKDGLTDQLEIKYGTDPYNPDTDKDGYKDGDEVKNGYNPNGPGKLLLK